MAVKPLRVAGGNLVHAILVGRQRVSWKRTDKLSSGGRAQSRDVTRNEHRSGRLL